MAAERPDQPTPLGAVQRRFTYPEEVLSDRRLSDGARTLLGLLGCRANRHGVAFVKLGTIAALLGISRPAVSLRLRKLVRPGYVYVTLRPARASIYYIPLADRTREYRPAGTAPSVRLSREAVRAMCAELQVPFQEPYVCKGPKHPGVDDEVWAVARALRRRGEPVEEIVALLEKNLAAQGRDRDAVPAAARRRAS
jgi:DNA-binding Lrp family transcriptional regulator